jgi:serine/threonine protein phosphatase 1
MGESGFRRTLCVGDIHGAHKALVQVLERARFDPKQDRLISLGDLTDYHPDSDKVLDLLLTVPNLVAVRGNHDTWAQEYLQTGERDVVWLHNGGDVTVTAFDRRDDGTQERYRRFFFKQVRYFVDERERLYVHASINHHKELVEQKDDDLYWGRELWTKAALFGMRGEAFPENLFHEIFLGHTPTNKIWPDCKPMHFGNIWNLDQGIKRTGRLTLMDVETKAYWQSDWAEDFFE